MVEAWRQLGLSIDWDRESALLTIDGCSGSPPQPFGDLFIANSGTSIRFLTAALAATHGDYRLDGVQRMRQRPIEDLLVGLRSLGADVGSENETHLNCPPVRIRARGLQGGLTEVAGDISSQFLSGLLMAAPYAQHDVTIRVRGELVSRPYVDMTIRVMESFGIEVEEQAEDLYSIRAPRTYRGMDYSIEPDASAASYFWAIAAIAGGSVRVEGLDFTSMQGDVEFARVLERMGCSVVSGEGWIEVSGGTLHGIDIDMNKISDTVQTIAPVALFAEGPTRIRGVSHNRHKETDRISDLACELRKLGAEIIEHPDGLTITPRSLRGATLETYRDHRMAMGLSLVGLRLAGTKIQDPRCTGKTFPDFFEVVGQLIGQSPRYE